MCGICGIINTKNNPVDSGRIQAMLEKIAFRGPDHEGVYQQENMVLGHRRLSIIDLSDKSNQPMVDNNKNHIIVFNGAIYNYPELRKQLQQLGHHFQSDGDTEVILKAFIQWGYDCVKQLHGMFAFAIWDKQKQELFLARDRLGIKPLYYSFANDNFIFASNMQAILTQAAEIDTSINPRGLQFLFTLHAVIPAPDTIIQGIQKLNPGYYMIVKQHKQPEKHRYWNLPPDIAQERKNWSEEDWTEAIELQLSSAIKKRLTIADVPVGVLLSGGLDSSLLVALLKQEGVDDLRTFSIGFNDIGEERGSEFEFSDQVVARYRTLHEKIHIPNSEVLSRLPQAIEHMSEPMFGQDAVAFYLLSEQVSKQVKVVQSGQGADELFGGYFWFPKMQQAKGTEAERFSNHYFDRDFAEYNEFISKACQGNNVSYEYIEEHFNSLGEQQDYLNKVLHLDVTTLIVDDPVKRVDNMTMAWGLEARVPFLDHELVELAAQMPSKYKVGSQGGKHILKTIARGKIPDAVIDRPKGYFPMPALKYVRGEFLDRMKDTLLSNSCLQRGIYQQNYIQKLIDNPEDSLNMTRLQGSKLWHAALLEMWLQMHHL